MFAMISSRMAACASSPPPALPRQSICCGLFTLLSTNDPASPTTYVMPAPTCHCHRQKQYTTVSYDRNIGQFANNMNIFSQSSRRKMSTNQADTSRYLVKVEDAKLFTRESMEAVGTQSRHAQALAEVLVLADQRGHYSHGLNRLEKYVAEMKTGRAVAGNEPFIDRETVSTALVNGNNALGCVVGNYAMQVAIAKARETGVGWVSANNSNHYGIAGMYGLQAAKQGLMGFSFTNTSPFLVPTRSQERFFGTNPICCAAPSTDPADPFVLDMATTAVAQGKVEVAHRTERAVPEGWGTDSSGKACTDPGEILHTGGLSPLGGLENTSGYKGSGLAMMVEVLCGILGGAAYATNIRTWDNAEGFANLGQCFIALDPGVFAPGFKERLTDMMKNYRELKPAEGEFEVLVAGDPERMSMKKVEENGGILYHPNFITYLDGLAEECQVARICRKPYNGV